MKIFQLVMSLAILGSIVGCVSLFRKKPTVAGKLGVAVIVLGGVSFAVRIIAFALTKEGGERTVLLAFAVLATPAIAYYWFRVWQRKRPDATTR